MAWERDSDTSTRMEVWRNTFTADGATAAFTAATIPGVFGMLVRVEWDPGSPYPDSSTTITITNDQGVNVLNSSATRDMTVAGACEPIDANGNAKIVPVSGDLSVALTTNATVSAIVTIVVYIVRFPR